MMTAASTISATIQAPGCCVKVLENLVQKTADGLKILFNGAG